MSAASMVPESIEYHFPHLPTSLFFSWLVWIGIIIISVIVVRTKKDVPGKMQAVFEMLFEYICGLADEIIGPTAARYYPLCIGLFFFLLIANLIGLVPGLYSPTADPMLTFGLAITVFIYFNYCGLRENGLAYFRQFAGPRLPWYLLPVSLLLSLTEVISFFIRPFSLGLRLFCNIFSKELFLAILAMLLLSFLASHNITERGLTIAPLLLRPVILLLGIIIGFIQALVFVVLSMSYIAGAVQMQEHHN
jgi:F-type H+-transporting ATPase subunit a